MIDLAASDDAGDDVVEDLLLHVQSRSRIAALAVVEEDRVGRARDRRLEVGVRVHDVRRLAAEFERDLLEVAGSGLDDQLADLSRACERDLVDVVVGRQRGAGIAEASDDVDDARGEPSLQQQLAEPERGQRRLLGGLQHDGACARQNRSELPRRHQQREVPRDDLPNHADRLAEGVREVLAGRRERRDRNGRALDLRRPARHIPEQVRRQRDVGGPRDRERLPVVERLEHRELVAVLLDQIGDLPDQPAAIGRVHPPPRRIVVERPPRGAHRAVDVLSLAHRDLGERLLGRGVDRRKSLARGGLDPIAIDQELVRGLYEAVRLLLAGYGNCHHHLLSAREPTSRTTRVSAHGSPFVTTEQPEFSVVIQTAPRVSFQSTMPRTRDELSAGEWAVLALLREEPAHGFALARAMAPDGEVGQVWAMRRPLVYRALETLEQRELIRPAPSRAARGRSARSSRSRRRDAGGDRVAGRAGEPRPGRPLAADAEALVHQPARRATRRRCSTRSASSSQLRPIVWRPPWTRARGSTARSSCGAFTLRRPRFSRTRTDRP